MVDASGNTASPTWEQSSGSVAVAPTVIAGPFSYSIAPTILEFLGVDRPSNFDGVVLAGVTRGSTSLPIKLTSFNAKVANNQIALNWVVAGEDKVNRYEVERSIDGKNFSLVDKITASGQHLYNVTDRNPATGVNYYRLKTVDENGDVAYPGSAFAKYSLTGKKFIIYPNPTATNQINIALDGYAPGIYTFKVVDISGKMIKRGQLNFQSATQASLTFDSNLATGVYMLYLDNGKDAVQAKLIKK